MKNASIGAHVGFGTSGLESGGEGLWSLGLYRLSPFSHGAFVCLGEGFFGGHINPDVNINPSTLKLINLKPPCHVRQNAGSFYCRQKANACPAQALDPFKGLGFKR